MDPAHRMADRELGSIERRMAESYAQALREIQGRMDRFLKQFEREDARYRKMVENGLRTESQYKRWRRDQVMDARRFRDLVGQLAQDLTDATGNAMESINASLPDIYSENFNWGTYEIEHGTTIETMFSLYDRDAVSALMADRALYPEASLDEAKDVRWNRQHINSAIAQGLLSGDPMDRIADRLKKVADMSASTAARAARTCVTAAENCGRVDSYRRAQSLGIEVKKQWLATLDRRTRYSHRRLDGESVGIGEKFSNGLMYPGDPDGQGSEVYNCRCTLVADLKDFPAEQVNRASKLGDMSYEEWKQEHRDRTIPTPAQEGALLPHVAEALGQDYVDAMDALLNFTEEQDAANLYRRYGNSVRVGDSRIGGGAYFDNADGRVYMNADLVRVGDGDLHRPYQAAFHEFGHAIDFMGLGDGTGKTAGAASVKWRGSDGRGLRQVLADDWKSYKMRRLELVFENEDEDLFENLVGGSPRYIARSILGDSYPEFLDMKRSELMSSPAFKKAVVEALDSGSMFIDNRSVVFYLKREHPDVGEGATVSDALEGLTDIDCPLGSGHGRDYHHKDGNTELEFFAEILDSKVCNPAALEFAREVFPNGVAAVEKILKEALT